MIRRSLLTLAVLFLAAASGFAAEKETKVLLIGRDRDHPGRTHTYMVDCELLAHCLRQTPGVEAVTSNGWPSDPAVLKGVTAIVLDTKLGGNVLFAPPNRKQAQELLKQGVGLVAIHWGTGGDNPEIGPEYFGAMGGWFNLAFSTYLVENSRIRQVDPEHPVCRGWKDFDLKEEFYIKLGFMDGAKAVMRAQVQGKDYVVGWVYERPDSKGGRSFGFVGGHFHDNFAEKPFRQAVVNGILWAARREIPENGAPCEIRPKDLEVPDLPEKK